MSTFHLAIICAQDDLLELFLNEFDSDTEFMEDCVLSTVEANARNDDLLGKNRLVPILKLFKEMFRPDDLIGGGNSLHVAAMFNPDCLKKLLVLLKRDSDMVREVVDIKDNLGQTALQVAVKNKDTSAASVLLDCGANIDTKNLNGRTPLHACRTTDMVEFLLQNGADPKIEDEYD